MLKVFLKLFLFYTLCHQCWCQSEERISEKKCKEYLNFQHLENDYDSEISVPTESAINIAIPSRPRFVGKPIREFPHIGIIGWPQRRPNVGYSFKCVGTLISERYVMTAANCNIDISGNSPSIVRFTDNSASTDGYKKDYQIEKIINHANYSQEKFYNDIALIKLTEDVKFTQNVRPACLYLGDVEAGELLTQTGFRFKGNVDNFLLKLDIPVTMHQECKEIYGTRFRGLKGGITEDQICTTEEGIDMCLVVGSPLQKHENYEFSVVGFTSFGIGCGGQYPGVNTKVSKYIDFIERHVWES